MIVRRAAAHLVAALGWLLAVVVGVIMITQLVGISGSSRLTAMQILTPWWVSAIVVVAIVACLRHRHTLAITAATVSLIGLGYLAPVVFAAGPRHVDASAPLLTVVHANLYFDSDQVSDATAAVLATDADVLVLVEFTPAFDAEFNRQAGDDYPYRQAAIIDTPEGIAVWSRRPLSNVRIEPIGVRMGIVATVGDGAEQMRLVAVHPSPPLTPFGREHWAPSLAEFSRIGATSGPPTMLIGDFNATRWHPPFRELLNDGWRDVHEVVGEGFSSSWPMDWRWIPPFARLDHALVDHRVEPLAVEDFEIPDSDHSGFVVTVALVGS